MPSYTMTAPILMAPEVVTWLVRWQGSDPGASANHVRGVSAIYLCADPFIPAGSPSAPTLPPPPSFLLSTGRPPPHAPAGPALATPAVLARRTRAHRRPVPQHQRPRQPSATASPLPRAAGASMLRSTGGSQIQVCSDPYCCCPCHSKNVGPPTSPHQPQETTTMGGYYGEGSTQFGMWEHY
jgi:hypothetical protein